MKNNVIRPNLIYALLWSTKGFFLYMLVYMFFIHFVQFAILLNIGFYFFLFRYIYKVLYKLSHKYEINKEQIILTFGVFSRTTEFLELYRVKDFRVYKSFLMRLIGVMEIKLITSDKMNKVFKFNGISSSSYAHYLRDLVELNRDRKRVYEID